MRQKVITHTNSFVEMGAWNQPLSEEEIEEFLINVKIQPTES
ncbi:hypothetical protein [Calothrix sp. PCC 7507]|nr:hypothetical protein [Calothrix sp. PCC 7507]